MLNSTSPRTSQINLFDPFQEPANWAERYGAEMFDSCCRGYEGIPFHEWVPANENVEPARISITFFPNQSAQAKWVREMTLAELGDLILTTNAKSKSKLPWLKFATFGKQRTENNCLRFNDNVLEISGCEADYDAGKIGFDEAVAITRKAGLNALLYTSASYSEAKPKWRILLPTSHLLPPSERAKLVARVNGVFGGIFDPASFVLSQAYYYGSVNNNPEHRAVVTAGDYVDLRDDLDADAIGKNGTPFENSSSREEGQNWAEGYGDEKNLEAAIEKTVKTVAAISNNDADWDKWNLVGMSTFNASGGSGEGFAVFDGYSRRSDRYDARRTVEKWLAYFKSPPKDVGYGKLKYLADQDNPGWDEPQAEEKQEREWPVLHPDALYGLTGKVVALFDPHTESDPVALLLQFMVCFGNALDRGPYYLVEGTKHHTNLNALLVGETGKSRKGTSADRIRQLMTGVAPNWVENCIQSGLSSGEGLIWVIRDEVVDGEGKVVHEGVHDKRLLLDEREFFGALTVMKRDGNTVSRFVRDGWDGREHMKSLTKNSPAAVTGAHISIIGHITADELRRMLDAVSMVNGYANRFLFACVRRSKYLPFGGSLDQSAIDALAQEIKEVAKPWDNANWADRYGAEERDGTARYVAGTEKRITMDAEARALWERVYRGLSEGQPGLVGAITQRGDAQTTRLALLYAVLDGSDQIKEVHLRAALALWKYCEDSARYIFGDSIGDPLSDELLRALRSSGEMTRTQIRDLFKRNKDSSKIEAALAALKKYGRVQCEMRSPKGRGPKVEVWIAT